MRLIKKIYATVMLVAITVIASPTTSQSFKNPNAPPQGFKYVSATTAFRYNGGVYDGTEGCKENNMMMDHEEDEKDLCRNFSVWVGDNCRITTQIAVLDQDNAVIHLTLFNGGYGLIKKGEIVDLDYHFLNRKNLEIKDITVANVWCSVVTRP